jgi:hypothetical protein
MRLLAAACAKRHFSPRALGRAGQGGISQNQN